jgi:hypothetical protein
MKKKMGLVQLSENELKGIKAGAEGIPCDWFCDWLCDATLICRLSGDPCAELFPPPPEFASTSSCPRK